MGLIQATNRQHRTDNRRQRGDTNAPQTLSRWRQPGSSRVPFWVYTDAQLYQRELEKIFYGEHWCYVGLEIEIPNVGDYKLDAPKSVAPPAKKP